MARAADRRRFEPCDADAAADLYDATQAVLGEAGFQAYEVSNHARGEAARSRHNLAVWRGAEYLGLGPGAHGRLVLGGRRTATRAAARIADYIAGVETTGTSVELERLDPRAAAEERLMLGLRIAEGVGLSEVAALGLDPAQAPVAPLVEAGLLSTGAGRLAATAAGRLVLDRVIAELVTGSDRAI